MRPIAISVPVPDRLFTVGRQIKRRFEREQDDVEKSLAGDRAIEWSWITARIPEGDGRALDFGSGHSDLGLAAAHRGFTVTAVDLQPIKWPYAHERLTFLKGNLLDQSFSSGLGQFDLVINCSAVEHVGLPGRYGVTVGHPDGDLAVMTELRSLMKGDATMLLTVPVGQDAVFVPLHRVYGSQRLPLLLDRFSVDLAEYWVKDAQNRWTQSDERTAMSARPLERLYGLGCFVLRKP